MKRFLFLLSALLLTIAGSSQNTLVQKDIFPRNSMGTVQQNIQTSSDYSLTHNNGREQGNLTDNLTNTTYSNVTNEKEYASDALDSWGVVGSATRNGWGGPDLPLNYNASANTWSTVVTLVNGYIKFRKNNDWAVNYGDNGADGSLDVNGSDIAVTAGVYLITLDFNTLTYSVVPATNRAIYVNNNSTTGDLFTTAIGNNSNAGTAAAPYATLQYAITQAAAGDVIYVDAGTYTGQVTIDRGITIIGAGQTLTFITNSSQLVAPSGPFTEYGLIQTTQGIGDVHIRDLTATNGNAGDGHTIMIQTGGSVKNCKLVNGGQGIFFRVESAIKTALIENNTIQNGSIGINCQGGGLTATIRSNTISNTSEYYSGIFAGLDFGPLPSLTITNNIVNNYASWGIGMYVSSFNGTINYNSFTGAGVAINRVGNGGNTLLASCNWFGTTDAGIIASKISGTVNYTPFLTSGTDGSSDPGFQPTATCPGGNKWYVNDKNVSGDIFTTAVGNNANAGTKTAPFATIQYAVNVAAANDIIYVDAGTYTEQVSTTKGITITGAGSNLTSILKPAVTTDPPASGTFAEQGVIQTAQNIGDVHIKDVSVTGDFNVNVTPIIIQSGGSVRNCKLQGGNQGLFVRVNPSTNPSATTFVVEGNEIDAEYIAVNFEGINITAVANNNTLTANIISGIWVFANRITATNNLFSKYVSSGIQVNTTNNSTITQNAFTGAGTLAINNTGANVTANCNWYGTATASSIVSKVNAGVTYYPWYVDGTDASSQAGFQHLGETCGAGTNVYYVNDGSTTGDIFTTTTGDDTNAGTTPTSPLATFGAALTKASPGAVIYMDAGTYTAQDATIDKQVQVLGTNYNTSPNSAADPLLLNSNRNAETIIENTNWIIGANSIYLDGLTFNPLGKQAITQINTTWSDTRFFRNRLRISSNLTQVGFGGSGAATMAPSAIANWNLNIRENRFEKEDASSGITLVVSRYGGVNINNNSFVVTGTTVRTQTAIFAGPGGVVNYLNIANNTFDRASNGIAISRLAIANMNFNKFINTSNALNGTNPLIESSEVRFRNNILDGSGGVVPFIQYIRSGGNAVAATSSFTAEENVITGTAVAGTTLLLGSMNLIFFNSVLNPSLNVRNNKITYAGDLSTVPAHFIRPIMLRGHLPNALVEKNEITLTAINQQPKTAGVDLPVSPAITLYTDNGTTSFLQPGSVVNILNNKIHGFKHSFAAYDAVNGNDTYIGYGNLYAGVTVNINNNSFTGDSISINNGPATNQNINATCNWYGSNNEENITSKISTASVNYTPWLTNGTDNETATGFQPVANSCNGYPRKLYVNDNSQTGDVFTTAVGSNANNGSPAAPFATINYAISVAETGDTIYVDAGTYVENISVNKKVVLRGANFGQNPGASLDRGNETIVIPSSTNLNLTGGSVINIAEADITVDGFTIDGNNPNINSGTLVNGVDVNAATGIFNNNNIISNLTVKNTIVVNTGTYGIALFRTFGNSTGPVVSGNSFIQNRVDNIGARGIVFAYSAYGSIINNFITRCGISGTWFSQINVANLNNSPGIVGGNYIEAANLGMQSSSLGINASAVYYLNNHIVGKSASALGLSLLIANPGGIQVTNNKFTDLNTGIAANNTGNQSNMMTVTITNNSFENISNLIFNILNNTYFDAKCNWYGSAAAQNFISKLPLTANLDILPWLTNGTDNDAAIGFQPVAGACDGYPTLITLNSSTNVTCNGAANGTISITATYGKAPITYSWTKEGDANFVSHDEDPTGLAPGTYTLSLVDGNGSAVYITDEEADGPGVITVTITEPDVLTTSTSGTNNICFNAAEGSASADVNGGTAPYTYFWSNGNTSNEINNLLAGVYTVTVTDANGCTTTASYEVTQPIQVTASITNNSTACSNIATVAAGGGTPGYSYSWSNGSTSATISGVPVGTYTVTVTDENGCTATASVNLTVTEAFNPSASATNISCFGLNNGSITVTNVNGSAPFMFSKDGGVTFVSGTLPYTFNNLEPNTYNIAVKDANGCVGFVERTVTQPTAIVATIGTVQSTCFGQSNGSINVSVSGGNPAYTYSWAREGGGYSSSQLNISGLTAGNYILTVTDKNNCSVTLPVTVPVYNEIIVNAAVTNVLCRNTTTGTINLTVSGGTGSGFVYSWTGAVISTNEDLTNIGSANNYNVRITDIGSGCFVDRSYQVTQPAALTITTSGTNASGCNNLGTITATAGGGAGNYQYSINGGSYQSSNVFTGLYAGTYTVTVRDGNGCTTTAVSRTLTDNGSDQYESNNGRTQSKPISIGATINARLANANDVADWFVITTPAGGGSQLYSLVITHPTAGISYTFDIYPASPNNAPALIPSGVIGTTRKDYTLNAGTSYRIGVTTTTLSFICYSLSVNPLVPVTSVNNSVRPQLETTSAILTDVLSSKVYPNPHRGSFTLSIESPEEGAATVEMYNAGGQLLSERKVNLMKGKGNQVQYFNMNQALLFYRVRIGKHVVNGKITGAN
jgi:Right handed beta helix region/SprB repeat/Protein of unknown function (DUF1565)